MPLVGTGEYSGVAEDHNGIVIVGWKKKVSV